MPTATSYEYSISNDFPNGKLDSDRLKSEILALVIVPSFDRIDTNAGVCSIWFRDALSTSEEQALDGVVANHSGDPLPENTVTKVRLYRDDTLPMAVTELGQLRATAEPVTTSKKTIYTHNFCDKTTWWQSSTRVVDEVATDSGDHTTYNLAHQFVIDTYHGKVTQEDILESTAGYSLRVSVKVNNVAKTERDPHELAMGNTSHGDYVVDYDAGTITFHSALEASDEVKVTYHYAVSADVSIKPDPGKRLEVVRIQAQFSDDVELKDSLVFQAYGYTISFAPQLAQSNGGPLPDQYLIPLGGPLVYKTMRDILNDADSLSHPFGILGNGGGETPTWRSLAKPRAAVKWEYLAATVLDASKGMEVVLSLSHNVPFGGSSAVATFYCTSEDL